MIEEELTPREQALNAIQDGNSVVINGISYSLRGEEGSNILKSVKDLPGEEAFVGNDSALRDSTLAKMARDLENMKAKYDTLKKTEDKQPEVAAKTETAKTETIRTDKA